MESNTFCFANLKQRHSTKQDDQELNTKQELREGKKNWQRTENLAWMTNKKQVC